MKRYPHEVNPPMHLRSAQAGPRVSILIGPTGLVDGIVEEVDPAGDPAAERALIAQERAAGLIPGDWQTTDPMNELRPLGSKVQ